MPNLNDQWNYWNEILAGNVSPKDVVGGLRWTWTKDFQSPFTLESLVPSKSAVTIAPQFPATFCDPVIQLFGRRPCAPEYTPPVHATSCPFKSLPVYSTLKGTLDNCCDVNPCYLSKQEITDMHSGPSYYYTEWGGYGPCSVTQGNGVKTRRRKCISHDETLCTDPEKESTICGNWLPWSGWGRCPFRCGTQQRSRGCSTGDDSDCAGVNRDVRRCNCFWGR